MKDFSKQPVLDKVYEEMNAAEKKLVKRAYKSRQEREGAEVSEMEHSIITAIRAYSGRVGNLAAKDFIRRELPELGF